MDGHIKIEKMALGYPAKSFGKIFLGPCDIDTAREWITTHGYTILDEKGNYIFAKAHTPGSEQCEEVTFRPFPAGSLDDEQVETI